MTILKRLWKAADAGGEGASDSTKRAYTNTIRPLAILVGIMTLLAVIMWASDAGISFSRWPYLP
ncbi:hypothetical protein [Achromobacter pestifer]|uniref:Uncharacterized protein n=1 Tax=Achromobacter pestifer TaxID=1353889 RepID=A0A6S6YQG7_9BURK|nr:hypothetical protein [Achromobacter pestifer]CAB3636428.1 hypothetical protein LMG3431_01638 [Achromobacter pestifer]